MSLFFREYDQTEMTELEHTTTVRRRITSENRYTIAIRDGSPCHGLEAH